MLVSFIIITTVFWKRDRHWKLRVVMMPTLLSLVALGGCHTDNLWGHQLLPDCTKPFTWANIDFPLVRLCAIHIKAITQWLPKPLLCTVSFKIIHVVLKLLPHSPRGQWVNTLRPRQNGRHFPDDILKWIFVNENLWISIKISLKFLPKGLINNIPALVQIIAWRRPGNKPLS